MAVRTPCIAITSSAREYAYMLAETLSKFKYPKVVGPGKAKLWDIPPIYDTYARELYKYFDMLGILHVSGETLWGRCVEIATEGIRSTQPITIR